MDKLTYKWYLKDIFNYEKRNNLKVFSCFSCGGGSTMGYKLAGYDVIGNCEIDPKVNKIYVKNHHPRINYCCDIRDLVKNDHLEDELYHLDILDGSFPCTSFTSCGIRERGWGKKKKFAEGQTLQTLDDLGFVFSDLIKKLQPKVAIGENVIGLAKGNARYYYFEIMKKLGKAGYETISYTLNGSQMGLPQRRERIFYIAIRKDIYKKPLILNFNEKPINFGEIKDNDDNSQTIFTKYYTLWKFRKNGDSGLQNACKRLYGKENFFNYKLLYDDVVANTIISSNRNILFDRPRYMNDKELCLCGSYPLDYDFMGKDPNYLIGMSVPPLMIMKISKEIYQQILKENDDK